MATESPLMRIAKKGPDNDHHISHGGSHHHDKSSQSQAESKDPRSDA